MGVGLFTGCGKQNVREGTKRIGEPTEEMQSYATLSIVNLNCEPVDFFAEIPPKVARNTFHESARLTPETFLICADVVLPDGAWTSQSDYSFSVIVSDAGFGSDYVVGGSTYHSSEFPEDHAAAIVKYKYVNEGAEYLRCEFTKPGYRTVVIPIPSCIQPGQVLWLGRVELVPD